MVRSSRDGGREKWEATAGVLLLSWDETGDRGKGGGDLQFVYLLPWLV